MLEEQPIVLIREVVDDDKLRDMLVTAAASGDHNFFGRFEYHFVGNPILTLARGQALLARCSELDPDAYAKLRKGTPFYWLAWATFEARDYETFAFYLDAAVSDDLARADAQGVDRPEYSSPALLFFLLDDANSDQALLRYVSTVRKKFEGAIGQYLARPGAVSLTLLGIQNWLLHRAIARENEHLRTLATTLISFVLEREHRSEMIRIRTEPGTAEPFLLHLFKGCVLFESLLKANPKAPLHVETTLGKILPLLQSELGFSAKPEFEIKRADLGGVLQKLASSDSSIYTAIELAAQTRNITGHNLGWQASLTAAQYDQLAACVAAACLHAIACLYAA